jgi:hypothetical protein
MSSSSKEDNVHGRCRNLIGKPDETRPVEGT